MKESETKQRMVNQHFEMAADPRDELRALAQRLQQAPGGMGDPRRVDLFQPPSAKAGRKSFLGRIRDAFSALTRLPQMRRRLAALEEKLARATNETDERDRRFRIELEEVARAAAKDDEALASRLAGTIDALANRLAGTIDALADRLASRIDALPPRIDEVRDGVHEAARRVDEVGRGAAREQTEIRNAVEALQRLLQAERATRQRAFTDFDRRLTIRDLRPAPEGEPAPASRAAPASTSLQSLLESFYFVLEDRYRGTREEIKQRSLVYRNDLRAARERAGTSGPVIDIGCGRGELLEALSEDGFLCLGVDTNETQLATARKHGGAVVHDDALAYLSSLDPGSVLAVTGMHIVEHIPFPDLVRLMQQVVRVLRKGGVAVFETPNPRNLIVGATTFHLDPTHIRPLPSEVMQILLEVVGFDRVEVRPLHPSDTLETMVKHHNLDRRLANLLFGPQDYAVVGVIEADAR